MTDSQSRSGGEGVRVVKSFDCLYTPKRCIFGNLQINTHLSKQHAPISFLSPPPPTHELYALSNFARVTMHVYFDNNYQLNCTFSFYLENHI